MGSLKSSTVLPYYLHAKSGPLGVLAGYLAYAAWAKLLDEELGGNRENISSFLDWFCQLLRLLGEGFFH